MAHFATKRAKKLPVEEFQSRTQSRCIIVFENFDRQGWDSSSNSHTTAQIREGVL